MRAGIRHPEELSLCRPADADDLRASSDAWLQAIRKQIFAEMNPDAPPAPSPSSRKRSGQKSSTANGGSRKDLSATSSTNLAPTQSAMSLRDGAAAPQRPPELYTSGSMYYTEQQALQKSPPSTLARTSTSSRTNLALNQNLGVGGTLSRSQLSVYGAGALTLTRSGTLAIIDENTPAADGAINANTLPPVSWRELHEASAAPLRTRTAQQRARLNSGYACDIFCYKYFTHKLFTFLFGFLYN